MRRTSPTFARERFDEQKNIQSLPMPIVRSVVEGRESSRWGAMEEAIVVKSSTPLGECRACKKIVPLNDSGICCDCFRASFKCIACGK